MNLPYHITPDSALPQVVPQEHTSYLYPASSDESPEVLLQKHENHVQTSYVPPPSKPTSRKWTAWPFLVLYGLVLALLAGLIGGFIGQAIERNARSNDTTAPLSTQAVISGTSLSPSPTATSRTTAPVTPSSSTSPNERVITIPSTGCNPVTQRVAIAGRSTFLQASYITICATGWVFDELIGLSAATPSDCIEACVQYNAAKRSMRRPDSEPNCVGGGFVPEWADQRQAMRENNANPFNCYLKNGTSGIIENDRDIEVVVLCLEGQCGSILG